jgi:hypothetical protein
MIQRTTDQPNKADMLVPACGVTEGQFVGLRALGLPTIDDDQDTLEKL